MQTYILILALYIFFTGLIDFGANIQNSKINPLLVYVIPLLTGWVNVPYQIGRILSKF